MPFLVAWLGPVLAWVGRGVVAAFIAKVVIGLGIGLATYAGFDILFGELESYVMSAWGGLPGDIAMFLGLMQFDVCLQMLLAAWSWRLTLQTLKLFRFVRR